MLRDKSLPSGHKWKVATAKGEPPKESLERKTTWLLLHAYVQNGKVWLEANRPRSVHLLLKSENSSKAHSCFLNFKDEAACLPSKVQANLGFGCDHAPKFLSWRPASKRKWFKIPVNNLELIGDDRESADLAQQLFWEFSGRVLCTNQSPNVRIPDTKPPDGPDISAEEKELTISGHQGELDKFVLEWRAIARSIAQCCKGNEALRLNRILSVERRIDLAARSVPTEWPFFKRNFVKELLKRRWPV
jgi:hypothetical protein